MADAPRWALDLVGDALAYYGPGHLVEVDVRWRRTTKRELSSGHAWPAARRLTVTAGTSRKDAKLVLLHELAHILNRSNKRHHHDADFWDMAWTLYKRFGVDLVYAQKREFKYKAAARAGYKRVIGKRALRIKPVSRHRHKWDVTKVIDHGDFITTEYICHALWYDSGKQCGAWKCDHKAKQEDKS